MNYSQFLTTIFNRIITIWIDDFLHGKHSVAVDVSRDVELIVVVESKCITLKSESFTNFIKFKKN